MSDSMAPDMFLARDDSAGYNLALGDPSELFWPFWSDYLDDHYVGFGFDKAKAKYPSINGQEALVESLKKEFPGYEYVVVANGAKQALLAAYYALRESEDRIRVRHQPGLRWPSHPTLARMSNLLWAEPFEFSPKDITLVTYPGNPVTYKFVPEVTYDIWDAVYASSTYGYDYNQPKARMKIMGAAKYLGLPGLRVGWLMTNEPKLAELAKQYVEFTTSGVSNYSQFVTDCCLDLIQRNRIEWNAVNRAIGSSLTHNLWYLEDSLREFLTSTPQVGGMFTYITFDDHRKAQEALKTANVKFVPGLACGDHYQGSYRVSLGLPETYFQEAILKLAKELAK